MKNHKNIIIITICTIFLFFVSLIIIVFLFFLKKDEEPIINNYNEQISETNSTNNNTLIVPIKPKKEEPEKPKIYGYDENAMQVASSYNGFPACGFLEIPKTGLALPLLSNQSVDGMEYSCCLLYTTGELNLSGNSYIVGHNRNNGKLFSNNKNLKVGDKIVLTGLYKNRLEYTIYNMFNTTPTDTSFLTKDIDDKYIELTIQTCNNDKNDTRLIIEARHEIKRQ